MKIRWKYEISTDDKLSKNNIVNIILKNRGIENREEFLSPPSPVDISLSDIDKSFGAPLKKTLKLLEKIKKNGEIVIVYTDYDADGITGGAILWETLYLLGFKTMPYVPHRTLEGYGFSKKGIDRVKKEYDPRLIISVDHGITAEEKIAYAKSQKILIVVTDHHLKSDTPPLSATSVFHIPQLSGSGVAYFFAKEIFKHFKKDISIINYKLLTANFSLDYLVLASVGTVADLVPLLGTSRSIVYHGLKAFPKIRRVGIKYILKEAGIAEKLITTYDIGFIIAPRINAVGRLEHAIDALRLLCTTNKERASRLAAHIGEKNKNRQDLVQTAIKEAIDIIEKKYKKLPKIIVLESQTWHEGIIGLIASKITDKYYRPAIVMTKSGGFLKGSARSVPALHITDFLRLHKKYLVDFGGHAQAAGFTIENKKAPSFLTAVQKNITKKLKEKDLEKIIEADIKLPISLITTDFANSLKMFEPYGIGNPTPSFISSVSVNSPRLVGKDNNHLVFESSNGIRFVYFSGKDSLNDINDRSFCEVVYTVETNKWNSHEQVYAKVLFIVK